MLISFRTDEHKLKMVLLSKSALNQEVAQKEVLFYSSRATQEFRTKL